MEWFGRHGYNITRYQKALKKGSNCNTYHHELQKNANKIGN